MKIKRVFLMVLDMFGIKGTVEGTSMLSHIRNGASEYQLPKETSGKLHMSHVNIKSLVSEASEARLKSYSPYSHFAVGAALLTKSGKQYLGCNIENASYTPTNCAERTAFFKAVSEGETEFEAIAIIAGPTDGRTYDSYCSPCGVCLQVMMEFCNPNQFRVILAKSPEDYKIYTLRELLPMGFGAADLH